MSYPASVTPRLRYAKKGLTRRVQGLTEDFQANFQAPGETTHHVVYGVFIHRVLPHARDGYLGE